MLKSQRKLNKKKPRRRSRLLTKVLKLKRQNFMTQASKLITTRKSILIHTLKKSRLVSKLRPLKRIKSPPMVLSTKSPKNSNQA